MVGRSSGEWAKPQTILAAIGTAIGLGTLVWSAATIVNGQLNLAHSFDDFRQSANGQFSSMRAEIASIPVQDSRLSAVERQLSQNAIHDATQDQRLGAVEQGQAVASVTLDSLRHDVNALQDAANARLPGQRK